ncbi:MAG TPA: hypothetical protein VMW38_20340 [Terriglobia bacterium]|nr:hypothetical protein [Terriglobia bacterium]
MYPDPISFGLTRIGDPQRWNLFSYTRNNPLRFVDPEGMEVTVFMEIQKQGPSFIQIHNEKHSVIFSYGRYAGGSSGSNARGLNPVGLGILIRIDGDKDVEKFLAVISDNCSFRAKILVDVRQLQ